jgi:outer membrane protein TolC
MMLHRPRATSLVTLVALSLLIPSPSSAQDADAAPADTPAAAAPPVEADAPVRLYSLDEIQEAARGHAAVLSAAEASIRAAEWKKYQAEWAWSPKIQSNSMLAPVPAQTDVNDLGANLDEIFALNIGPFFRQTINVVLPLYTFGRIDAARRLADVNVRNSELERRKAELELGHQITQAYWGLKLARAFTDMLVDGDKLVKERLEEMEDARAFGEADFETKDLRKLQIFSAELDSRALDNRKLTTLAVAGIEYLSGVEVTERSVTPLSQDVVVEPLEPLQYYLDLASTDRPEVLQLQAALQARRAAVDLARAGFFPNLYVAANFTFGRSTEVIARQPVCRLVGGECVETDLAAAPYGNPYRQTSLGVVLGLRWNLDVTTTYGAYKESQALQEQTQAQHRQAMGAIELEVRKLWVEADQAAQKVEITKRRLLAARRWRDQIGLGAQNGGDTDLSEAIEPLQAYYAAKVLHLQSIYDYKVARSALAVGVGTSALERKAAAEGAAAPGDAPAPE